MEFVNEIIDLLHEEGLEIEYSGDDLDLREHIADSIQFISFIVDVEKKFGIEIPSEYLLYDSISSLHSFVNIIRICIEEDTNAHNN